MNMKKKYLDLLNTEAYCNTDSPISRQAAVCWTVSWSHNVKFSSSSLAAFPDTSAIVWSRSTCALHARVVDFA